MIYNSRNYISLIGSYRDGQHSLSIYNSRNYISLIGSTPDVPSMFDLQ